MIKEKLKNNINRLSNINFKLKKEKPDKKSLKVRPKFSLKIKTELKIPNNFKEVLMKLQENIKLSQSLSTRFKPNLSTFCRESSANLSPKIQKITKRTEEIALYMDFDDIVKQLKKKKKIHVEPYIGSQASSGTKKINSKIKSINFNDDKRSIANRIHTFKTENLLKPIIESEENNLKQSKLRIITPFSINFIGPNVNIKRDDDKKSTCSPLYPKNSNRKKIHNKVFPIKKGELEMDKNKKFKKMISLQFFNEDSKQNSSKNFENFLLDVKDFQSGTEFESV